QAAAVGRGRLGERVVQAVEGEVLERVGADERADLLGAVRGGDELVPPGGVDAVVTGTDGGGRADAQVDLPRPGLADHGDDLARGGAADDGVVDDHHPAPHQHLAHRRQLQLHAEAADLLRGLDEGAADVVRAHQALAEGDAALPGVADGGGPARVGHGDDHVGGD